MRSLQLVASQPAPKTWGEGLVVGHAEGYEQGRRDCGLERVAVGFFLGIICCAVIVLVLR